MFHVWLGRYWGAKGYNIRKQLILLELGRWNSDKVIVGKGVAYLYLETTIALVSGYLFWLVMSKITTPEVIGTSSAIISFAAIVTSLVTLGLPSGIQRFLAKRLAEQQMDEARAFAFTSMALLLASVIVASIVVWFLRGWITALFAINIDYVLMTILLIVAAAFCALLHSIVIATLNTRIAAFGMVVSTIAKMAISIILIGMGSGVIAILAGFTVNNMLLALMLGLSAIAILKSHKKLVLSISKFVEISSELIKASTVSWIPTFILTIGSQLGTLVVFQSTEAGQTGVYFIALSILLGVTGIMYSLLTISYPVLSSMTDGRKRFASKMIKLTILLSMPVAMSFMFYSDEIMSLLGPEYATGSRALEILLLSVFPVAITTGTNQLAYANGNYRYVLILGLASNLPRVLLYFVLVPYYGGDGAAMAYTAGSAIGLVTSIFLARRMGLRFDWKMLSVIVSISSGVSFVLSYFNIQYVIGIVSSLAFAYLVSVRLKVIGKSDLKDSIAFLPRYISHPLNRIIDRIS